MAQALPFYELLENCVRIEQRQFALPAASAQEYLTNLHWLQKRFLDYWPQHRQEIVSRGKEYFIKASFLPEEYSHYTLSAGAYELLQEDREQAFRELALIEVARKKVLSEGSFSSAYNHGPLSEQEEICTFWENYALPQSAFFITLSSLQALEKWDSNLLGKLQVR